MKSDDLRRNLRRDLVEQASDLFAAMEHFIEDTGYRWNRTDPHSFDPGLSVETDEEWDEMDDYEETAAHSKMSYALRVLEGLAKTWGIDDLPWKPAGYDGFWSLKE